MAKKKIKVFDMALDEVVERPVAGKSRGMKAVIRDMIDGSGVSRQDILEKRIQNAIDGVTSMKAVQDKLAGITRRKA